MNPIKSEQKLSSACLNILRFLQLSSGNGYFSPIDYELQYKAA